MEKRSNYSITNLQSEGQDGDSGGLETSAETLSGSHTDAVPHVAKLSSQDISQLLRPSPTRPTTADVHSYPDRIAAFVACVGDTAQV